MPEPLKNNGFLVKNDRFPLGDVSEFILTGWVLPETTISAAVNGSAAPCRLEKLSDEISFLQRGYPAKVYIKIPDTENVRTDLKVWSHSVEKGDHMCFRISRKKLLEKRGGIRLFIDDYTVNRGEDLVRIQGWAVSKQKLTMQVTDTHNNALDHKLEHYVRKDVVSLFEEDEIDGHCGFNIEISPIPKVSGIKLSLRAGMDELYEEFPLGKAGITAGKVREKVHKGKQYLDYNGFGAFTKKVWQTFFGPDTKAQPYHIWLPKHLPSKRELELQRQEKFEDPVKFSIVVPLYKTPEKYLRELIDSIRAQTYQNYEIVFSDGSGIPSPVRGYMKEYENDPKIRVIYNDEQLDISENTNRAINAASGDYIVFCDHDDILAEHALYENVKLINEHPDADFIYSDEDKLAVGNKFTQPHLKPDFNFDLLCTVNYICHLVVARRSFVLETGLLNDEFNGAQDYDFVLRCTENTKAIYHIPKILYHWRISESSTADDPEAKKYAFEAGRRAIEAHYARLGIPATVSFGEFAGLYRTEYHWQEKPMVSIIIPNKDHIDDLDRCISSIEKKCRYENREYVIIENNSTDPATFEYYEDIKKRARNVNVVTYEGDFNYAAINNYGVSFAKGDYILLLNNDTELINDDSIEKLLYICMRPDVGAVGARLYFEDDTIQHAGCVIGFAGIAGHCFVQQKKNVTGYCHRIIETQDYSAVTAACMMVKKSVFEEVGGLYEGLAVAFNDMDLCLKINAAGYHVVYEPYAELYHYESKSRGQEDNPEKIARFNSEIEVFQQRWPDILKNGDPYYNPNLSLETQDFSLKRI